MLMENRVTVKYEIILIVIATVRMFVFVYTRVFGCEMEM